MLHRPRAQRRADLRHLSVTTDTLPTRLAYLHREVRPDCHLIVVRDGACYGEIVRRYATDLGLPCWVRRRLGATAGIDLERYAGHRPGDWWDPGWEVGPVDAELLERLDDGRGLLTRWPHAWLL